MSLEFMGHFDGEGPLIGLAYSYEQATKLRVDPNLGCAAQPHEVSPVRGPGLRPAPPGLVLGSIAFVIVGLGHVVQRRIA